VMLMLVHKSTSNKELPVLIKTPFIVYMQNIF